MTIEPELRDGLVEINRSLTEILAAIKELISAVYSLQHEWNGKPRSAITPRKSELAWFEAELGPHELLAVPLEKFQNVSLKLYCSKLKQLNWKLLS